MEEETNPYLIMRAQKIARNEARLRELGLLRPVKSIGKGQAPRSIHRKKAIPPTTDSPPSLRRSSRHSNRPETLELPEPKRRKASERSESREPAPVTPERDEEVQTFPAHSARAMSIDVENLVLGGLLGRPMEKTGKAFVMESAARRAGIGVHNISFNKYSGVQEWENDALFLWVNLGNGGDVVNDFLNGGRQITWFGGSRMHDETKVIRRLLRVGKSLGAATGNASDGIVLWCRSYDAFKKSHSPYVCLGRLSYHSHEPGSRPLKFVWNLVDYDRLVNHKDESVRITFQELVNM